MNSSELKLNATFVDEDGRTASIEWGLKLQWISRCRVSAIVTSVPLDVQCVYIPQKAFILSINSKPWYTFETKKQLEEYLCENSVRTVSYATNREAFAKLAEDDLNKLKDARKRKQREERFKEKKQALSTRKLKF